MSWFSLSSFRMAQWKGNTTQTNFFKKNTWVVRAFDVFPPRNMNVRLCCGLSGELFMRGKYLFLDSQNTSVQFSCSVMSDSMRPMDCSTPDPRVHHQLLEFTQTHVHWVSDIIQPSHPLSSPCPPAFNLSQHQGLFKWVSSLHQVAKVLEFQLQHQSFQWILRTDLL